ncbi:S8 family serine peptidase [Virgibacillus sp. C22-A2]|uniref:S8 family serine peptidase n=1 Tax=Virgibacillus tibetensis TaxID=3042313 RepID=A0ABU6KJ65_9BACI|nr:S8 family serine peptidase [Virgibacillus sp. C22-A2]
MKKKRQTRAFSIAATFLMTFSLIAPGITSAESNGKLHHSLNDSNNVSQVKVSERLFDEFMKDDKVTFLVKFSEKADTVKVAKEAKESSANAKLSAQQSEFIQRSAVVSELRETSLTSQYNVKKYLETELATGNVKDFNSYHIVNGMSVTATKEVAEKIATFAEVEKILPNETRELYTTVTEDAKTPESEIANVEWNVERVGAPAVWDMGIDGSGTVVASIDTGVQWDHPALKEKYRGYDAATDEVDHDFNWFDATVGQDEAYDDQGHGTHVTGTMVGSEPDNSNQVGVAPGAQWIAVKAFTAAGGTDVDLLAAAEWILAPTDSDGNARVDMAPDVVNNSWGGGPGLDEWYRDVVINWRAAEIFPEFSAGNTTFTNPGGPGSVAVPANYPESFATGATDINDGLASFSLQGPSPYDEIKPDISAPGVNIRSSVPGGGYEGGWNGTSMSGPAVSAVVALLRQADASLSVDDIEDILLSTATPLTNSQFPDSPNNGFGYGLVNAYDAVSSMISGLGTLEGQVTKEGEDNEAPTFEHEAPSETYAGMNLDLSIQVSDNVSVASVELNYQDADGAEQTVEASRISGDFKSGEYVALIPGEHIDGDSLTYYWVINDFGNNEVTSEEYTVAVAQGITVGYLEDFESAPAGWTVFGENNSWERGVPTSGPGSATSGENVYATNLDGPYDNYANTSLMMPPIDLPEENTSLQFNQWYNIENNWDFGHVFISTDQEDWVQLMRMTNVSDGWESTEIDLSEYSGQRVYISFNLTTDVSVVRDGLYIDDVALVDTSVDSSASQENGIENTSVHALNEVLPLNSGVTDKIDKDTLKEKVIVSEIQPMQSKEQETPTVKEAINPTLLPLGAQVSVLESGRSVNTSPADGSYSILHAAGEFTVLAEAYGYASQQQSVVIERDEVSSVDFTLEEVEQNTVSGIVTDEATGEVIEGATVLLVEDANITPVETDGDGSYSLTAYEGMYTLKVLARGYHGTEVAVNLEDGDTEVNISLEPFYTVPGGEIGYDDGTAENARAFYDAGNGWAVRMSLPEGKDSAIVTDGVFQFHDADWPNPGGTEFAVEVWDATGANGTPGQKIAGPIEAEAVRSLDEWTIVDLRENAIQVDGDFYMVYIQTGAYPNVPGLATDENGPYAERSYQVVGGAWSQSPASEGNYMIRARVSYEVDAPVITSPAEDLITNEAEITVEGSASPTTTLQLLNNGEEAGTTEVGDDGNFAITTELAEGDNEITAVTLLNGAPVDESDSVTVTLDTESPELTIDSPQDGDKTNRETVTVEGAVVDANLDFVEVNGQKATVTDGSYSKRILLDNGSNEIEVIAQDLAGNSSSETVTIEVKYNAPEIENLTPTEDQEVQAGETVMIEFDSESGLDATFTVHMPLTNITGQPSNATELPMRETTEGHYVGYWTVPSNVLAEGAVIEVKVVDDFDNETRAQAEGKVFITEEDGNGNGKGKGKGKDNGNGNNGKGNN